MNAHLLKVSLRQGAVFIPKSAILANVNQASKDTFRFILNIQKLGFSVSEDLMRALEYVTPEYKRKIFNLLNVIRGTNLNWASLVKGWDIPTGESALDYLITYFSNALKSKNGTILPCGHLIPNNTFPLERYNGCPYCGTPFEFGKIENYGQGSKLKILKLWTEEDVLSFYKSLLESRTALDATQVDSLKILLKELPIPEVEVKMKESIMLVVDAFVNKGEGEKALRYFTTPNDVLRYLWYKKTGFLQIIEPRTIIHSTVRNNSNLCNASDQSNEKLQEVKNQLKLKYTRSECRVVAMWLNSLLVDAQKASEMMHAKRGMWVRFIRALRLAEYAKKKGFDNLKHFLDVFYNEDYAVWQGEVNQFKLKLDASKTFELLKQRPGLFARSLFATMLWFGAEDTLKAFSEIVDKVPARLLLTLNMYAVDYFDSKQSRVVKPLGSVSKKIEANKMLALYTKDQLKDMVIQVEKLCFDVMSTRFASLSTENKTMYIDPQLFNIPLPIGDRSETVQDTAAALMGTRFKVEGNTVRLFMQWGKGLPAQHLDMDLSCQIFYTDKSEFCAYYNLVTTGAKHSGDIQRIPNEIGTAEYIELDINELKQAGAKYVVFTSNAYSNGSLSPNMVIGWMNSAYPMKISEKTGVAYDPSCVQHQVKVTKSLAKGLVFGVLDVNEAEIIWLEMSFEGQRIDNLDGSALFTFLKKLKAKTSIGKLLTWKADAQHLHIVDNEEEADEVYSLQWALNTAEVTKLLVD